MQISFLIFLTFFMKVYLILKKEKYSITHDGVCIYLNDNDLENIKKIKNLSFINFSTSCTFPENVSWIENDFFVFKNTKSFYLNAYASKFLKAIKIDKDSFVETFVVNCTSNNEIDWIEKNEHLIIISNIKRLYLYDYACKLLMILCIENFLYINTHLYINISIPNNAYLMKEQLINLNMLFLNNIENITLENDASEFLKKLNRNLEVLDIFCSKEKNINNWLNENENIIIKENISYLIINEYAILLLLNLEINENATIKNLEIYSTINFKFSYENITLFLKKNINEISFYPHESNIPEIFDNNENSLVN